MQTTQTSYITTPKGRKTAVVLPIREYRRLLEDLHDLGMVAERHDEYPVSLTEMKQRLSDHVKI